MTPGSRHNYRVDIENDPYLYVEALGNSSVEQADEFLKDVEGIFSRRGHKSFVAVVDITRLTLSSPRERRQFATFFEKTESYWRANCVAYAFVAAGIIQRGFLTALFWIKPMAWPTRIFERKSDADEWVYSVLKKIDQSRVKPEQPRA